MKKNFKNLLKDTKLPYSKDAKGNLQWIGGSAEAPLIVTTYYDGILRRELVGGKSAKQADLYRKFNGIGVTLTNDLQEKIDRIKSLGFRVENQFAVTDFAYQLFIASLLPELRSHLTTDLLNIQDPETFTVAETACQTLLRNKKFDDAFIEAVTIAYAWLDTLNPGVPRAIRSTAPSEDGAEFSGSGKYSTKLKKYGVGEAIDSIHACFISRFNRGALHYQFSAKQAFGEDLAILSFGVMVQDMDTRIDCAGTLFSADTASKHRGFMELNATYGLGEAVVSGRVSSDVWIFAKKPLRNDKKSLITFKLGDKQERFDGQWHENTADERARKCMNDEVATKIALGGLLLADLFRHLDPDSEESDFEVAMNLDSEAIILTQQRAVTTLFREPIHTKFDLAGRSLDGIETDDLRNHGLLKDQGINAGIPGIVHGVTLSLFGEGPAFKAAFPAQFRAKRAEIYAQYGANVNIILVTAMTFPWMEPYMELCAACVTSRGGKNDHTPIWCKEHGLPCSVSVKEAATKLLDKQMVTYYGVDESPIFYTGRQQYTLTTTKLVGLTKSPIPIRLIMSDANNARQVWSQSYFPELNIGMGSGLVRWEMLASKLGVHPMAIINYGTLEQDFLQLVPKGMMTHDEALLHAKEVKEFIDQAAKGYDSPIQWYIQSLAREIAGIVSPFYTDDINEPMVVRLPDFKTNEHADLRGGRAYEPIEENPMLGERGAGKYLSNYKTAFTQIDLVALATVINDMGYHNIHIEVPFVRTTTEMTAVKAMIEEAGITIPIDMMFELPVNVSRAIDFFQVSHGGQIGSNDLLQLEFGLDRSGGYITDDHIEHLKFRIQKLISRRNRHQIDNNTVFHLGLCGNLPSTDARFANWLASSGIEEFSVTPDALIPALLGVTGDSPEGKQTVTTFLGDGSVLVNGEAVMSAV